MNSPTHRLRNETAEQTSSTQSAQQSQAREFNSAEELIRADASQITVPPSVRERLAESLAKEHGANLPWWKKLFR